MKIGATAFYIGSKIDGSLRTAGAASSPVEKSIPLDSQSTKCFGLLDSFYSQDQRAALSIEKLVGGESLIT